MKHIKVSRQSIAWQTGSLALPRLQRTEEWLTQHSKPLPWSLWWIICLNEDWQWPVLGPDGLKHSFFNLHETKPFSSLEKGSRKLDLIYLYFTLFLWTLEQRWAWRCCWEYCTYMSVCAKQCPKQADQPASWHTVVGKLCQFPVAHMFQ